MMIITSSRYTKNHYAYSRCGKEWRYQAFCVKLKLNITDTFLLKQTNYIESILHGIKVVLKGVHTLLKETFYV